MTMNDKVRTDCRVALYVLDSAEKRISAAYNVLNRTLADVEPPCADTVTDNLLDTMTLVRETLGSVIDSDFPSLKQLVSTAEYDFVELMLKLKEEENEGEVKSDDTEA